MADDRKQIGARLPKDLVSRLGHVSIDRDVTLNDLIEGALAAWYNAQPEAEVYGYIAEKLEPKGRLTRNTPHAHAEQPTENTTTTQPTKAARKRSG